MKNVIRLFLMIGILTIALPYALSRFNFYTPSFANAQPNVNIGHTDSTVLQSTSLPSRVSYADAVGLASPAVVSIKTTKELAVENMHPLYQDPMFRQFFGIPRNYGEQDFEEDATLQRHSNKAMPYKEILKGLGSGVIVDAKGYILTNNHVIKDTKSVIVTLADGRTADGKVIGTDPDSDLAVLKIDLDKLPVIAMGASATLRPGDLVLAIGNPFGYEKTVTQGIISALERSSTEVFKSGNEVGILNNLIQTDAAINPGNSGGALIDSYGKLVGINTVIHSNTGGYQGIGFAIPIDQANDIMKQLIAGKHISRGFLGVSLQALNAEIREYLNYKEGDGVFIRALVKGSPAEKAGLLPGDVITKINNVAIKEQQMGLTEVSKLKPNQQYPIEIFRKGDHLTFTVMLGERKQSGAEKAKVK
jgi:Do/DeqQ family serine protease